MPNTKNSKGFALLPILIVSALLITGTYFGYNWYTSSQNNHQSDNEVLTLNSNSESEGDVLQANTDINMNMNINKFVEANFLFESNTGYAVLWGTDDKLYMSGKYSDAKNFPDPVEIRECGFFTRTAKPIAITQKYSVKGVPKTFTYKAYQSQFLALAKMQQGADSTYIVLAIPVNSKEVLVPNTGIKFVPNDCGNFIVFKKPASLTGPITPESLFKFYTIQGADNGKVYTTTPVTNIPNTATYGYSQNGKFIRVSFSGSDAGGAIENFKKSKVEVISKQPIIVNRNQRAVMEKVVEVPNMLDALKIFKEEMGIDPSKPVRPVTYFIDIPNEPSIYSISVSDQAYFKNKKFNFKLQPSAPKSIGADYNLTNSFDLKSKKTIVPINIPTSPAILTAPAKK